MIHRVHTNSVAELNRILELIQKGAVQATENVRSEVQRSTGGSSAATGLVGPAGPQGPAGADGVMDVDLLLVELTEEEEIIMQNGSVVHDEYGYAITETHVDYDLITDEDGSIVTAE